MERGEITPADAARLLNELCNENIPTPRGRLTIRSADEILNLKLDPADCLMGDRLLAKGQPIVIAGQGSIGKSRLLLQLSVCCITGMDWCGFNTHVQGLRWLILQTENSNHRLQVDLEALRKWAGKKWKADSLFLHTLENDQDALVSLSESRTAKELEHAIHRIKPDVVVIDPFRDFMVGDPNSDADMEEIRLMTLGALCRRGNPQASDHNSAPCANRESGRRESFRLREVRFRAQQQGSPRVDSRANQRCSRHTRQQ